MLRRSYARAGVARSCLPLLLVVVLAAVAPPAGAAPALDCPGKTERPYGRWRLNPVDTFPTRLPLENLASPPATGFAVDPHNPRLMFVSDWNSVLRSTDGGCTWEKAFSLYDLDAPAPPLGCEGDLNFATFYADGCLRITSIDVASGGSGPARVFVQIHRVYRTPVYFPAGYTTFVLVSKDGGDTFSLLDPTGSENALSIVGTGGLAVAPSDPNTIYATRGDWTHHHIFVSHDAGETWNRVNAPIGVVGSAPVIDPGDPNHIWTYVTDADANKVLANRLWRSTDGGISWEAVTSPLETVNHITIGRVGDKVRVFIAYNVTARVFYSDDLGGTWREMPKLEDDMSEKEGTLVVGRNADELFVIGYTQVVRHLIKRGVGVVLKSTTFSEEVPIGDGQSHGIHSPSGGLHLLLGCYNDADRCWIGRYPSR